MTPPHTDGLYSMLFSDKRIFIGFMPHLLSFHFCQLSVKKCIRLRLKQGNIITYKCKHLKKYILYLHPDLIHVIFIYFTTVVRFY